MKKIVLFITFLCFTGICYTQNMVSNPGFEDWTGSDLDDWTYESGVTITQETTTVHSGSSSAKVLLTTQDQGNTDTQNTEFAVNPGDPFDCSVWVYDNDPAGRTTIVLYWNGASTTYTGIYSSDQDSWQQLTYSGTVPTGATGLQVGFRFYDVSPWTGSATMYVDDYSWEVSTFSEIVKAYSRSQDELDVLYNLDVTSVDPADYELTGSATITFSTATIDGTNPKLVHLSGASTPMVDDYTLDSISDDAKSSYDFYAGITSIFYTNEANSPYIINNTNYASFEGIVSATTDAHVWISDASDAYCGVLIYDYDLDDQVTMGDEILISAKRDEYYNLTELTNPTLIDIISTGNSPYGPDVISGSDINDTMPADTDPAERWEGQLVKINNAEVTSTRTKGEYKATDDEGSTHFNIGELIYSSLSLNVGSIYNITGVVHFTYGHYEICPRSSSDIVLVDDTEPPVISVIIVTNATTVEVFFNEYVEEISAETTTNYTILSRDVSVTDAVLDGADPTHVTLTVTGMTYGDYILFASGVEDLSGNPSYDSHNFTYSSLPEPGDIVINEIMQNPSAVADANGEYFELYNATDHEIDINGWTVRDNGSDSFVIDNGGPLTIASHGYLVLGNDGDPLTNGGYTCDYAYSGLYLGNSEDELILEYGRAIIDSVYWDNGVTFPDPTGASMELDPAHQNSVENDDGANWYTAYTPYGDGDSGTPGSANPGPRPPAPVGIIIQIVGNDILLTWSPGATKASYNIYRSGNPYNSFSLLDSTSDTTYTDTDAATTESKYFYYVTEVE